MDSLLAIHFPVLPRNDAEALECLAQDPRNAEALIVVYERNRTEFNKTAAHWFGGNAELRRRALNEILVAVGQRASTYDPELMEAADWIGRCANSEARRLRRMIDSTVLQRRGPKQRRIH
jgi:hypothetical protein